MTGSIVIYVRCCLVTYVLTSHLSVSHSSISYLDLETYLIFSLLAQLIDYSYYGDQDQDNFWTVGRRTYHMFLH